MTNFELMVVVVLLAVVALLALVLVRLRRSPQAPEVSPSSGEGAVAAGPSGGQSVGPSALLTAHESVPTAELTELRTELGRAAQRDREQLAALAELKHDLTRAETERATLAEHLDQARQQASALAVSEAELRGGQQALQAAQTANEAEVQRQRRLAQDLEELRAQLRDRERQVDQRDSELKAAGDDLQRTRTAMEQSQRELEQSLGRRTEDLERRASEVDELTERASAELERVAGLDAEAARAEVLRQVEHEARISAASLARSIEDEARRDAETRARDIVVTAVQRVAADATADAVITVVELPHEEMKGRIIGREGRNIRAFEQITGVNVVIDDTPDLVLLSSFDPVRREVARLTLTNLVADGRIHPVRIEEEYERSLDRIDEECLRAADDALLDVGITDLDPDLKPILGSLRYRTSYGQNVLQHLVECAHLADLMARELGLDPTTAKRAAFLHDIGKALTHEAEGTHAMVGAELAHRHGESDDVVHAIEAHHNEVEPRTVEALLTQAADAISGSRPGARREPLEAYVQRMEQVERIAGDHDGVDRVFAMQAGREVRVMVLPDEVSDAQARKLVQQIADQIQTEVTFPGQIRVTVIRESRATATAH